MGGEFTSRFAATRRCCASAELLLKFRPFLPAYGPQIHRSDGNNHTVKSAHARLGCDKSPYDRYNAAILGYRPDVRPVQGNKLPKPKLDASPIKPKTITLTKGSLWYQARPTESENDTANGF